MHARSWPALVRTAALLPIVLLCTPGCSHRALPIAALPVQVDAGGDGPPGQDGPDGGSTTTLTCDQNGVSVGGQRIDQCVQWTVPVDQITAASAACLAMLGATGTEPCRDVGGFGVCAGATVGGFPATVWMFADDLTRTTVEASARCAQMGGAFTPASGDPPFTTYHVATAASATIPGGGRGVAVIASAAGVFRIAWSDRSNKNATISGTVTSAGTFQAVQGMTGSEQISFDASTITFSSSPGNTVHGFDVITTSDPITIDARINGYASGVTFYFTSAAGAESTTANPALFTTP